jgi:hypothetical protein
MPFWDRFVLWPYLGLADTLPVGRDIIGRLFDRVFALGRLDPTVLSDLRILLLLVAGRPNTDLRLAANQETNRRRLAVRPQRACRARDAARAARRQPAGGQEGTCRLTPLWSPVREKFLTL